MFTLRDGSSVQDRRLDRLVQFDEQSRSFGILTTVRADLPFRSYTRRCAATLDQGADGACVGFACAHELSARPVEVRVDEDMAHSIYRAAQKIDPWPGEAYEGTSVLAGVKTLHKEGWMESYRWAFGEKELRIGVGYYGPAIVGSNWYEGMYQPDARGFLNLTGQVVGGHAYLVNAYNLRRDAYCVHNSWGPYWAEMGEAWISTRDMARLLSERGEAVFFSGRKIAA